MSTILQKRWVCDVCNMKWFLVFEEACAHEEKCTGAQQPNEDEDTTTTATTTTTDATTTITEATDATVSIDTAAQVAISANAPIAAPIISTNAQVVISATMPVPVAAATAGVVAAASAGVTPATTGKRQLAFTSISNENEKKPKIACTVVTPNDMPSEAALQGHLASVLKTAPRIKRKIALQLIINALATGLFPNDMLNGMKLSQLPCGSAAAMICGFEKLDEAKQLFTSGSPSDQIILDQMEMTCNFATGINTEEADEQIQLVAITIASLLR